MRHINEDFLDDIDIKRTDAKKKVVDQIDAARSNDENDYQYVFQFYSLSQQKKTNFNLETIQEQYEFVMESFREVESFSDVENEEKCRYKFMANIDFKDPIRYLKFIVALYRAFGSLCDSVQVFDHERRTFCQPFELLPQLARFMYKYYIAVWHCFTNILSLIEFVVEMTPEKLERMEKKFRYDVFAEEVWNANRKPVFRFVSVSDSRMRPVEWLNEYCKDISVDIKKNIVDNGLLKQWRGRIATPDKINIVPPYSATPYDNWTPRPLQRIFFSAYNNGMSIMFFALLDVYEEAGQLYYHAVGLCENNVDRALVALTRVFGKEFEKVFRKQWRRY